MKISVITPVYAIAGVPLAQIRLAKALSSQGHNVHLLIGRILSGYNVSHQTDIKVTIFSKKSVVRLFVPLMRYLIMEKPDVIFSAEDHLNVVVLAALIFSGSKAKISCSSRVSPFDTYSNTILSKKWVLKCLYKLFMRRANVLSCVSHDMVSQYETVFSAARFNGIYNIVVTSDAIPMMSESVDHPWFYEKTTPLLIAAGRLAPWKGFLDLIDAIALVKLICPVRLVILGDGPLKLELLNRIHSHGLGEEIQLLGYVRNPLKYFARSDIFVLSSHIEGLPNVLVEAMMCGCTPVATDCPTGPREVLDNGKYGYLVKPRDPKSISAGILKALDQRIPRQLLNRAVQPFDEKEVLNRQFTLLGIDSSNLSDLPRL